MHCALVVRRVLSLAVCKDYTTATVSQNLAASQQQEAPCTVDHVPAECPATTEGSDQRWFGSPGHKGRLQVTSTDNGVVQAARPGRLGPSNWCEESQESSTDMHAKTLKV